MQSRLGILNSEKLAEVESSLIRNKIELLSYDFTFDKEDYDFDFLIQIHKYLFADIYILENNNLQEYIDENIVEIINRLMHRLTEKGIDLTFDEETLEIFDEIWRMQIFKDGNTRTLIAFLKIYVSAFMLDKYVDFQEFKEDWNRGFSFARIRIKK